MEEQFYTIQEIAGKMNLHRNTVIRLIQRRRLGATLFGSRYRVSETQLQEYIRHNTISTEDNKLNA